MNKLRKIGRILSENASADLLQSYMSILKDFDPFKFNFPKQTCMP